MQTESKTILLIEDNRADARLIQAALAEVGHTRFEITWVDSIQESLEVLARRTPDAILLDLSLPDSSGLETLDLMLPAAPAIPIVALTGLSDEEVAIEAVRRGAQDYLIKGRSDGWSVARAIQHAIDRKRAEQAVKEARDLLEVKVQERTAELAAAVAELRQTNKALRMLTGCNEALVRIENENELIQEICRIIVETGGYRMAWVGFPQHDELKTVRPAAAVGFEEGYLSRVRISWADNALGAGPTGTAIRTGKPCVGADFLNDPHLAAWRKEAVRRGFRSSIALPLMADGEVFGALTIYAGHVAAFSAGQAAVLGELASDLAYGIAALRTRTALAESRHRLAKVVSNSPIILWATDENGICILVEGRLEPLGITPGDVSGRSVNEFFADRIDVQRFVERAFRGEEVTAEVEYRGFIFESRYSPLRDAAGQSTGILCVATDITDRRRVEREVLEAAEREQRRIGRDLHDSIQGALTGIRFMVEALEHKLRQHVPGTGKMADDARKISELLSQTVNQTRSLSRGLCPIDLKADGLVTALSRLADITSTLFRRPCTFHCRDGVLIDDERVAAHLYYICQEAVNNSLKHGNAENITIHIERRGDIMEITVEDDGVGLPDGLAQCQGMGLRTMSYRAQVIGASLSVRRGEKCGTRVTCSLRHPQGF